MEPDSSDAAPPALLSPGTQVGPWRVIALAGRGVHGEVYRAVSTGDAQALPVALKVSRKPWDARMSREVALLSQVHHTSVPRLVDHGVWRPPNGSPPHPYLAMEWIEAEPLYAWAQSHSPTSPQVAGLLCQVAQALEAVHALGGVHRDVKGDNVLVRREDGRAVLVDFGSSWLPGASTLTPPGAWVGTPAYRSTEAWLLELRSLRQPDARHAPGPADDVFALGVTACRLLTGQYVEPGEPRQDASGAWSLDEVLIPPALQAVDEPLQGLVRSMLTPLPEQRPSAAQLARALEQASRAELEPAKAKGTSGERVPQTPSRRRSRVRAWTVLAAVSLSLAVGAAWLLGRPSEETAELACWEPTGPGQPEAGTAGLAEATSLVSRQEPGGLCSEQAVADEPLPEPQPGQTRMDAKGHCPRPTQIALNGVCWAQTQDRALCEALDGQMYKGTCYVPSIPRGRQPTSSPEGNESRAQ